MSEYRTVFRPEAQAELRKIPRDMALRILAKLTELEAGASRRRGPGGTLTTGPNSAFRRRPAPHTGRVPQENAPDVSSDNEPRE